MHAVDILSIRHLLTDSRKLERKKNARVSEKRFAERADLEKNGYKKNRERMFAIKGRRLNNEKSLETLSAQAARKWITHQQEQ